MLRVSQKPRPFKKMVRGAVSPLKNILSFILFQVCWWGLFLTAKHVGSTVNILVIGTLFLITGLFLFIQLQFFSTNQRDDLVLAKKGFLLGLVVDGPMILFRFLSPGPALNSLGTSQQWALLCLTLVLLWVIFSMTLNSSLRSVRSHPIAFIVLCGFFGPITYLATEKLFFLKYSEPQLISVSLHTVLWALWGWQLSSKNTKSALGPG